MTGTPGIGFLLPQGTAYRMVIVLDPHTYRFRSYAVTEQHPGQPIRLPGR